MASCRSWCRGESSAGQAEYGVGEQLSRNSNISKLLFTANIFSSL